MLCANMLHRLGDNRPCAVEVRLELNGEGELDEIVRIGVRLRRVRDKQAPRSDDIDLRAFGG